MSEIATEERDTSVSADGDPGDDPQRLGDPAAANDEDEAETVRSRKRLPFVIAGVILGVALIAIFAYWLYSRQFESTDDAFISGEIVQISPKVSAYVAKIHVKDNQLVQKGDLLIELDAAALQAKLESAQSQLRAAEAQKIRALARTDLVRTTASAEQAEARYRVQTALSGVEQSSMTSDARRSEIAQAESSARTARADLERIRARIPSSESNLRLAEIEHKRSESLFAGGSVSRQSLERSENAMQLAKAELEAARSEVRASESRVGEADSAVETARSKYREALSQIEGSRSAVDESLGRLTGAESVPKKVAVERSEIDAADAAIAEANAAVQTADLELSYAQIFAPQDGFVTHKNVNEGQLVEPGSALMALSQSGVWVVANFKETQLERMRIGQRVDIVIDAFPAETFRGRVDSFQAGTGSAFSVLPAENASGNFVKVVQRIPVKIVFEETPANVHLLVPGMSVQPRVWVR